MPFCTHCGSDNPENATFCADCGRQIASSPSAQSESQRRRWLLPLLAAGIAMIVVVAGIVWASTRSSVVAEKERSPVSAEQDATQNTTTIAASATAAVVTSARMLDTFPYHIATLSPNGRLVFYEMPLDQRPDGRLVPSYCVEDVGTGVESCVNVPVGSVNGPPIPVWTQESDRVVWTPQYNTDVFVYDVPTNTVSNLTDDEQLELVVGEVGEGELKMAPNIKPTWISNDEEIVFFLPYWRESLFRNDLHSIDLEGTETAHVIGPTYEQMFQGKMLLRPRWVPRNWSPLPHGDRSVLVAGRGAVFSVDLDRGTTSIVAEYADQYEKAIRGVGEALGFSIAPNLWPIAHLTDDRILLADPLVFDAIRQSGHPANATSGAYVLDTASGAMFPLFRRSPDGEYGGPIAVALSPDGAELLVVWFDSALTDSSSYADGIPGRYVASILDVDSIDSPIDPRDLRQIYGSATDPSLRPSIGFAVEWAENDTVLLSTLSDEGKGSVLIELLRE